MPPSQLSPAIALASLCVILARPLLTMAAASGHEGPLNVLGTPLQVCSVDPLTGYMRDGYCMYNPRDGGAHIVCAQVTSAFLEYTAAQGNDLSTPRPEFRFPGLRDGDRWCLCAVRWKQAYDQDPDLAPPLVLEATHERVLDYVPLEILRSKALTTTISN